MNDTSTTPDFETRLANFVKGCERIWFDYRARHYPSSVDARFETKRTPRYVKVYVRGPGTQDSIHVFVALDNFSTRALGQVRRGDVLKPAGVKVPARGARGNIFDEHNGLGRMGPYGPAYNR